MGDFGVGQMMGQLTAGESKVSTNLNFRSKEKFQFNFFAKSLFYFQILFYFIIIRHIKINKLTKLFYSFINHARL